MIRDMRTWLGLALLVDVLGLVAAVVLGNDPGPLDELALALAAGVAGAALPRTGDTP